MANDRRIVTVEYLESEGLNHKQDYFADVAADEVTGNRELSLKDANNNVVGKIIAQKEGGVLLKDVATPTEATDGANKGYADNNFANALKGTASGASVRLDDVSPIEHTLGVKVRGKNLFDINTTPTFTRTGATYTVGGTTITFKSNNTTNNSFFYSIPVEIGKTYTVSVSSIDWDSTSQGIFLSSTNAVDHKDYGIINKTTLSKTFTAIANTLWIHGYMSYSAGDFTFSFDKLQIEFGTTATAYTPYISDFSTVTVTGCGKNLFDKSTLTAGTNIVELTQTANGFTFKTTATSKTMNVGSNIYLPAGTYYCSGTVTCSDTTYKGGWAVYDNENKVFIINNAYKGTVDGSFTITEGKTYQLNFYAPYNAPIGITMTFGNVQLELGSTATEYEPYKMPTEYTPAVDGTVSGVKSLYPTTTLMTDTEVAIIEAEYNRDINKAFAELQQAILSMGGNT